MKHILILIFFISSYNYILSQELSFKFEHFGKKDGLNQSSVNCIFQDNKDYLWIASFGGINKFDGYSFLSYSNQLNNNKTIADNSVWVIYQLKDNSLWFGNKAGLSLYNELEDNFINYIIDSKRNEGSLAVKALYQDKNQKFYVGTEGSGLYTFSLKEKKFHKVTLIPSDAKISAITEDSKKNLWVGTENKGLFKISPNRNISISYLDSNLLNVQTIWSLYADEKENLWIGTDIDGLVKISLRNHEIIYYKKDKNKYDYQAGNKIKTITKGHNNEIWIGSATNGLSYYSYSENRFYNYTKNRYENNSLYDNDVSSVFAGANGVLYVGFYMNGFDKVNRIPFYVIKNNPNETNTLSNNNVYCMYYDNNETIWMGTFGGGLNEYNLRTKTFKTYKYNENNPKSISHNWVRIITEDKNGDLWVGTWGGGLNKFNKKSKTFKRYLPNGSINSLNHNIITAVFEDSDKELWIGTYGNGINIYQAKTDDFISIVHNPEDDNSLSDNHITSFYEDKEGVIWICTYGGGLNAYNKKTKVFKRYLPDSTNIYSLNNTKTLHIFNEADSNFYWITTLGGGINKFYHESGKFFGYTEKDGLSNNSTMGMLKDKQSNYWISTNNGISRFNPKTLHFTNYTTQDGLGSDDYNLEAYIKTKDGTLFFGGKQGVTFFNPDDVKIDSTFPKVYFTKLIINDSTIYNFSKKIKLKYKDHLTVEFAAINPNKTNKIYYQYQLLDQDTVWRNLDKVKHLEFSNLSPGDYELRIRSTNGDKIWNTSYQSIHIYVKPPWYMTWTARIIGILAIIISIYSYYKIKLNRARAYNILLEKKIEERTKTISEKNIAILKEKDKTEEAYKQLKKLEVYKNDLTNMIVHDLKNPLVSILGLTSGAQESKTLSIINNSGHLMLNLIENMLEVQKFENSEVKLNLQEFSVAKLIDEAIAHAEVAAKEKNLEIVTKINSKSTMHADREIILRVIINLLSNAIKFSPDNGRIEIIEHLEENDISIQVKDFGKGISKEFLPIIFEKFKQADVVNQGKIKSTGLGLTFCKHAITAHGGQIWVESLINEGSSFFIKLKRGNDLDKEQAIKKQSIKYLDENIVFTSEEKLAVEPFVSKLRKLSIYEIGEWVEIIEKLNETNSASINRWSELMLKSLTTFNENRFNWLKELILE